MYHALLFLHVLSAFLMVSGVVIFSAFVLGSPVTRPLKLSAEILWGVGGVGTIVFGIWLALNRPQYGILDGWIVAAVVLWVLANGAGAQVSRAIKPGDGESPAALDRRAKFSHWMRVLWVLLLLIDMVWKPGA
jgi:uncharacterized membrane protein